MGSLSVAVKGVPAAGLRVKRERAMRLWTQSAVAAALGISHQVISAVESGRYKPWPKLRRQLAELYEVPEQELFADLEPVGQLVPDLAPRPRRRLR